MNPKENENVMASLWKPVLDERESILSAYEDLVKSPLTCAPSNISGYFNALIKPYKSIMRYDHEPEYYLQNIEPECAETIRALGKRISDLLSIFENDGIRRAGKGIIDEMKWRVPHKLRGEFVCRDQSFDDRIRKET